MKKLISIEFFKLKRSTIWLVITLLPVISVLWGVCFVFIFRAVPADIKAEFTKVLPGGSDTWYILFSGSASLYMPLMLPILTAVIMTWITRLEHQQNAWKSLLTLPVRRSSLFMSKFITGILLMFISIFSLSFFMIIAAIALGATGPMPLLLLVLKPFISGLTALPIAALFIIISMHFSNAAVPIAIGGVLSLPVSLIANSERLWLLYPWSYPARYALGNATGQENLIIAMFAVCILSVLILTLFGLLSFKKKDII